MDAGAGTRARPCSTKTGASSEAVNNAVVATSSLVLIGSFFWVPAGLWYFWRRKCTTRRRKALFLAVLLAAMLAPVPTNRRVAKFFLWNRFLRYFSGKVVGERGAATGRQALFCLVPHGVFPFGVALASIGDLNQKYFHSLRPVVASAIARAPLIGQILSLIGAVSASPAAMDRALKQGHSLGLAPGGIAEMFLDGKAGSEFALVRKRKGFVRKAIANGVPIVPVFVFGNSETFRRANLPSLLETASRLLQASLVLFWGRVGLPIPFKVPLTFAVGRPVEVGLTMNPSPSEAEVDRLHAAFCDALTETFERHKHACGWGHKTLELL